MLPCISVKNCWCWSSSPSLPARCFCNLCNPLLKAGKDFLENLRAFFVRADKNPVVILCFAERDLLSLVCTLFWSFFNFIAKDGFLERLSLSTTLYFIVTDKRCLLAAVDRNVFLDIITEQVNMFEKFQPDRLNFLSNKGLFSYKHPVTFVINIIIAKKTVTIS